MHCTKYFLGRLHQRAILTGCEYDELLAAARTLHTRSVLNKKLMDVINYKPSQLQESFADLLGHFESRLVHADEEALKTSGALSHTLKCKCFLGKKKIKQCFSILFWTNLNLGEEHQIETTKCLQKHVKNINYIYNYITIYKYIY